MWRPNSWQFLSGLDSEEHNIRRNWSETEVASAISLYLRLDFGKFHSRNPEIIKLAGKLERTPSAIALKLANLAALDVSIPQRGMANASALDRKMWAEFLTSPDRVLQTYATQPKTKLSDPEGFAERQAKYESKQATHRHAIVTTRVGQDFFREMILTSYKSRCALTGTDDPRLLTASHIVGWAEDKSLRLNPSNGIALNALHDRAFDRHLITFNEDFRLVIHSDVPSEARKMLERVNSTKLDMPSRFLPD